MQKPGWNFAHAQDDMKLRILYMFKGSLLIDAAHIM